MKTININEKDIIRQQLILKHSKEILRLERNIEKKTVIIRKLEKESNSYKRGFDNCFRGALDYITETNKE